MVNPLTTQGIFSWQELMTTDIEAAKEFYGTVVGWTFETDSSSGMEYTVVKAGDTKVAGFLDRKDAMVDNKESIPPHWGAYITVTDINASVSLVAEHGGNVIVPVTPIPNIGAFAVIQDPQGAVVSLMEYTVTSMEGC
jgi:uncharacterized protein